MEDQLTPFEHAPDHLIGAFQYTNLLPGSKADHGVGSDLHMLNQIGIENDRCLIQTCEVDHFFGP